MAASDGGDRTRGDQVSGVKGVHVNIRIVHVVGEGPTAETLRGYLRQLGYRLAEQGSAYVVRVEDGSQGAVALEGIRGPLADHALHAIAELAGTAVEWRMAKAGSERELSVSVPDATSDAAARGLLRALLRVTGHGEAEPPSWVGKFFRRESK